MRDPPPTTTRARGQPTPASTPRDFLATDHSPPLVGVKLVRPRLRLRALQPDNLPRVRQQSRQPRGSPRRRTTRPPDDRTQITGAAPSCALDTSDPHGCGSMGRATSQPRIANQAIATDGAAVRNISCRAGGLKTSLTGNRGGEPRNGVQSRPSRTACPLIRTRDSAPSLTPSPANTSAQQVDSRMTSRNLRSDHRRCPVKCVVSNSRRVACRWSDRIVPADVPFSPRARATARHDWLSFTA
jgi:hypothetical protein